MKEIYDYLRSQVDHFRDNEGGELSDTSKLEAYQDILVRMNKVQPELCVCPDCSADLAYTLDRTERKFHLVFIRHNS